MLVWMRNGDRGWIASCPGSQERGTLDARADHRGDPAMDRRTQLPRQPRHVGSGRNSPRRVPCDSMVRNVCGSWRSALAEAGVVVREQWTRELVIAAIQRWTAEHGSPPTYKAWGRAGIPRGKFPTPSTVRKVCGSWRSALAEAGVLVPREQRWRSLDPAFGHWLAGLIDGEGSFGIGRVKRGYGARLSVQLRNDDSAILTEIHVRTGRGSIGRRSARSNSRPGCVWMVQSRADTEELVEILDQYPLRSKKAADYVIWRRAVELLSAMPREHRDWMPIVELKRELESVRQYRPPSVDVKSGLAPARARP